MRSKFLLALFLGIIAVGLTTYYYLHQRSYSQQYKTVLNAFHTLQKNYDTLSYEILKNSIYSYNNQDEISNGMQTLNTDYANLYNAPLLHDEQYLTLDYPLINLGTLIADYNTAIEHYLMINAGIKNSFVFLLNYTENAHDLFAPEDTIHTDINAIVSELSNTRRLLDARHLKTVDEHLLSLNDYHTASREQKAFLETVSLHANYILNNFSEYAAIIAKLQGKEIDTASDILKQDFNQIAQTDFIWIDKLAVLLLIFIVSAIIVIMLLLLRSGRENHRLVMLKEELEHTVSFDTLTGLLNRNSFNRTMMHNEYKKPTFLLINVNGFKHINDLYGSEIGDYILQEVSQLIKLPIFQDFNPRYYRLGGDDFGILLEDIAPKKVLGFAEALDQSIKHFIFVDNEIEINITVSIAINTQLPLLENADMVLKHFKKKSSESIVVFSKELKLREQIQNNINVLQSLSDAIDQKRIIPYFQPIIDLKRGEILKYEALIRQVSPDGHIIGPDQFLDLAAQTPHYHELTRIMIEHVFSVFEDQPYRFSINLSMRDLLDKELMQMLESLLQNNTESAKRLEIELLESEHLFDMQVAEHYITLLKSYGCRIAIDDFGTGYSNFSYLAKLSVDTLKIDGSLISKIMTDDKYCKTVKTIVHYADALGVETVAEFVETKEIALKLKEIGITYGQGYYFDRPQPTVTQKEIVL